MQLTDAFLRLICPQITSARRAELLPFLNAAMERFGISRSKFRMAAYLANLMHESGNFTRTVEDLNYSASRLTQVWPRRFPTVASAQPYAHNPRALAVKVYSNRMGNASDRDAFAYIGRGGIQRTGRYGYERATEALGVDFLAHPELLERPEFFTLSDALYWSDQGLNRLADCLRGRRDANEQKVLTSICKRINGGTTGLDERVKNYWRCLAVLDRAPAAVAASIMVESNIARNGGIPTPETHTAEEIAAAKGHVVTEAIAEREEVREQVKAASIIDLAERTPASVIQATATSLWARTGGAILRIALTIFAALQAGNLFAWGGIAVVALILLWTLYSNRHDLRRWYNLVILKTQEIFTGA